MALQETSLAYMFCLFPNIQVMGWSCDNTLYKMNILENCFFQISSYSHAYVGIIYEKTKGQVPLGPLAETKTYKLKRHGKTGNKKRATCFAILLQNELSSGVAPFPTHVRTC